MQQKFLNAIISMFIYTCFCGAGNQTQGLVHAMQAICHTLGPLGHLIFSINVLMALWYLHHA